MVGTFDPHDGDCKLVFNVRELPLAATLLEAPGCIPAHRHTRFAPLLVPERVRNEGSRAGRSAAPLGQPVPNLSPRGLDWAGRVGGPREAFRRIAAFLNSPEVQDVWAPAFGCSRVMPVPLSTERVQRPLKHPSFLMFCGAVRLLPPRRSDTFNARLPGGLIRWHLVADH